MNLSFLPILSDSLDGVSHPPPKEVHPIPTPSESICMQRKRTRFLFLFILLAGFWLPAQAQQFIFEFKGPDTLIVDNDCGAILALDLDSLIVQSAIGATIVDTTLTITGQYMLGDTLPPGTVVTFNWEAIDDQGNDSIFVFTIIVLDLTAPNFSSVLPPDITVTCPNIPAPAVITVFDNCDPNPQITLMEVVANGACTGDYSLTRLWTATDNQGNFRTHEQVITVVDNTPPVLLGVPSDVTVQCNSVPQPPVIGMDITATDGCDTMVTITLNTMTIAGACAGNYDIIRTWTATDDCGNAVSQSQTLTVVDTQAPTISGVPADITVDCDNIPGPPVIGPGGITATDNCDATPAILAQQSSNQDPDPTACGHTNYEITRTWISTDHCGLVQSESQVLFVRDRQAPTLYCLTQDTLEVDPGVCDVSGSLVRILFASDNCTPTGQASLVDTAAILNTSGTPLLSGVVDNMLFTLPFSGLPTNYVTGGISLTINLIQADAEQPSEFYNIFGEDGTLLGQTNPTPSQCGSGQTILTSLTADQLNAWAADGQMNILLVPNGSGVDAINQICPGGKVGIALNFDYAITPPAGLDLNYRIDNGPLKPVQSGMETLVAGEYTVDVFASDCSGNTDSCSYNLVVEDNQHPLLICPAPLDISTNSNACFATVNMPFPLNVTDNCGFTENYQALVGPVDLVFYQDPNAGIIPQDQLPVFTMAPISGTGSALLTIFLKGDIANAGEFFNVYGENNTFLGVTGQSAPAQECSDEVAFTFALSASQIKSWSADGQVEFRITSNNDVISFSDFINPCGPLSPNNTDGTSKVRFQLSYNAVEIAYSIEDNTNQIVNTGVLTSPNQPKLVQLPIGAYTVTYTVEDVHGNATSCTWPIVVQDKVQPQIVCKPGFFAKANPSGLVALSLDEGDLLVAPGTDNCGIASYSVFPNAFTCNDAGNNFNVRVIAFDMSGNSDTCFTLVAIANEELTPQFSLDTCGGNLQLIPDTTFTLPTPGTGNYFIYVWTSNNGFFSNQSSPIIPDPKGSDAGIYTLTIEGLTGCVSTGSVQIDIDPNGAFRPELESNSPICQGDSIRLSTDWLGAQMYEWTHIQTGLVYNTSVPQLVLQSDLLNAGTWTLRVVPQPGCPSAVSLETEVMIHPIALQMPDTLAACQGDSIALPAVGVNIAKYTWTAPDGAIYAGANPMVSILEGFYTLEVENPQGCTIRDTLHIAIRQRPVITALSHSCPECVGGFEECELVPSVFPPDQGGTYMYSWTGPGGNVISQDSVATLTNVSGANSGLYTLQVQNPDNTCRSVPASLFLVLNDRPVTPAIAVENDPPSNPFTICADEDLVISVTNTTYTGDVRFIWHGPLGSDTTSVASITIPAITVNQAGTYQLEVVANGCVSNMSNAVVIQVNPTPFPPVISSNSPICEGDTLQLCATFVAGATYEWVGPAGVSGQNNCLVLPLATTNLTGVYQVRIGVNGCLSSLTEPFSVEVRARPTAPVITDNCNGAVCRDVPAGCELTVLNPIPGAQYAWYDSQTDTLIAFTGTNQNTGFPFPGNYTDGSYGFYAIAEVNGCRSVAPVIHTVTINTIPNQIADAGPDMVVCESDVLQLCAQQPLIGTGQWLQSAGNPVTLLTPGNPCTVVQGFQGGESLIFNWSLSNGACLNYSTDLNAVTISQFENAVADTLIAICRDDVVTLNAEAGLYGPGQWTQSPGQAASGVTILAPGVPDAQVEGLQPGNAYSFTWTLENGACASSAVTVLVNNFDDQAFAGADKADCGYGCLTLPLTADFATLGGGKWYSPDQSITLTATSETGTQACGLKPGNNLFIWELNEGVCGASAYDTLIVNYAFGPLATNDTFNVAFAGQALFNLLGNDVVYGSVTTSIIGLPGQGELVKGSEGNYIYTAPANFTGITEFRYRVCSTICPDVCTEARIIVDVSVNTSCEVPTIITPNRDGINDMLVIPCLAQDGRFLNNSLSIFNQWGDEVYSAAPYGNDWDGLYNSQLLPAGTYFYVFKPGDEEPPVSGFILIKY